MLHAPGEEARGGRAADDGWSGNKPGLEQPWFFWAATSAKIYSFVIIGSILSNQLYKYVIRESSIVQAGLI